MRPSSWPSRAARSQAKTNLVEAEQNLKDQRAELATHPKTLVKTAFGTLLADRGARAKLDAAAAGLGLSDLSRDAEAFRAAASGLGDETRRLALLQSGMVRRLSQPVAAGLIVAAALAVSTGLAWALSGSNLLPVPAAQAGAAVAGVVGPLALGLRWAVGRTNAALDSLREFRAMLDAKIEEEVRAKAAQVSARTKELAEAESKVAEAARELQLASERADEAERAYKGETSSRRVLNFVRSRVEQGDYAKHLSFIATVRKDFEELSRLMTPPPSPEAAKAAEAALEAHRARVKAIADKLPELDDAEKKKLEGTPTKDEVEPVAFERIVLYIDDLDRCGHREVIAVLQAIHLLLTFPLFVVFVAVDVRWLRRALVETYPGQIADERGNGATASDYLEKIFQIPYWVRQHDANVTRKLLQDRMGPPESEDGRTEEPPPDAEPGEGEPGEPPAGDEATSSSQDVGEPARPVPRPVRLTTAERKCIETMAGALDGLPRRTLRFINTYWIIKGSLSGPEQHHLEVGGCRALAALLAIAIALEDAFPDYLGGAGLLQASDGAVDPGGPGRGPLVVRPDLQARVARCVELAEQPSEADLRRYAPLVSRFSFHRGSLGA